MGKLLLIISGLILIINNYPLIKNLFLRKNQ
jgi:hypothetical protein